MKIPVLLSILLFQVGFCVAQNRVLLGGFLKNHVTGEPINAVHVMNLTDSLATISSPEGVFKIPVHLGDSLVFSCIGYHTKALILTEKELLADYIQLTMVQRDYQLAEVEVNPFGSKEQFRQKFMELQTDDGTIEIIGVQGPSKERRTVPVTEDKDEIKKAKYILSPASFIYGNLSKDAKARQELHRLEGERDKHSYNDRKFNEEMVSRITGYEGARLNEFMNYCNFSEDQIFRYSEYEMTVAIMNKQRAFEGK